MRKRNTVLHYARQVWTIVVLQMVVDVVAALFLLFAVGLIAAGLVLLAGHLLGVTQQHIRSATAILGLIYVLVIFARALRRHWIVAGQMSQEPGTAEANAQPSLSEQPQSDPVGAEQEVSEEADVERPTSSA